MRQRTSHWLSGAEFQTHTHSRMHACIQTHTAQHKHRKGIAVAQLLAGKSNWNCLECFVSFHFHIRMHLTFVLKLLAVLVFLFLAIVVVVTVGMLVFVQHVGFGRALVNACRCRCHCACLCMYVCGRVNMYMLVWQRLFYCYLNSV